MDMTKSNVLVFIMAVFLVGTGSLYAADLKDGFFDIQWRTDLSQSAGFTKIGENENVKYFASPKRVFTIDDIKISNVVYGAYANQFFAVYLNIETIEIFSQLRRHLSSKYGLPKMAMGMPSEQTTYQWKYQKTKIKLKTHENRNNMKMAFYYTPLSSLVNEAQQEAFAETLSRPIFPLNKTKMQNAIDLQELMGSSLGPPR
jgi:hypothetical protein